MSTTEQFTARNEEIPESLAAIRSRVAACSTSNPNPATLLDFGENYVQELEDKAKARFAGASSFLIPLCQQSQITYAATTRSGGSSTIKFEFQPNSDDPEPYERLPDAKRVLITFPLAVSGASKRLVRMYLSTRQESGREPAAFIQLGTTSIWDKSPASAGGSVFYDRHSEFTLTGRARAEVELLALSPSVAPTTVLNLAGLWGGQRVVRKWLPRVAPTKDALAGKVGYIYAYLHPSIYPEGPSLHLIHGLDLARAILAVHADFSKAAGQRWLLTDGRVDDWWDLASAWGAAEEAATRGAAESASASPSGAAESSTQDKAVQDGPASWVRELMRAHSIRVLPRDTTLLGRILDSRDFWWEFGLAPVRARLEGGD
ncbi:hypothetical protein K438DRAFT_1979304 [Mycena galopus ATCC 62051]|nr:hypothetical protein K438DRAFT_1979304 [Mycena galopus ATCC 62051]